MNSNRHRSQACARRRRGMAVYMYVMTAALMISLLALASISVVRVERRQIAVIGNRLTARTLAHSGVELGLFTISSSSNWRSTYANGVATTPLTVIAGSTDSVSWSFSDTDGSLINSDVQLRMKGIGRSGDAVQVASVQLQREVIGPVTHRSLTWSGTNENVKSDRWAGQYFKPILPADAFQWWVSSVELYMRRDHNNETFRVRLYRPNGSNMPTSEILDQVNLNSNAFSTGWGWQTITFSGAYMLNPGDGLCLCVETTAADPVDLESVSGVSATNSARLRGDPAWDQYETDKALRYRVFGYYMSASSVQPVSGTWLWDAP